MLKKLGDSLIYTVKVLLQLFFWTFIILPIIILLILIVAIVWGML